MKKLINALIVIALGMAALPANAAIAIANHAVVANPTGTSVSTLTTASRTTSASGSTFLIELVTNGTPATTPATDSFGNTYVLKSSIVAIFSSVTFSIYECDNCTGGAGHTATVTLTGGAGLAVFFQEVTGAATSAFDVQNTFTQNTSTATQAGASVTTTNAADLVVSLFGTSGPTASNDTAGWNSIIDTSNPSALSGTQTAVVSFQVESSTGSFHDSYANAPTDFSGGATIALKQGLPPVINGAVLSNGKPILSGSAVLFQ